MSAAFAPPNGPGARLRRIPPTAGAGAEALAARSLPRTDRTQGWPVSCSALLNDALDPTEATARDPFADGE